MKKYLLNVLIAIDVSILKVTYQYLFLLKAVFLHLLQMSLC